MEIIARNKQAYFNYRIVDDYEAGLVLLGPEIKAIRAKQLNINGSYVKPFINKDKISELWWVGSNFNIEVGDKTRTKKLLLHKTEIERLIGKLSAKNYTILPLEVYFKRGRAKLKIGLGERKQEQDRREEIRNRDIKRDAEREFRGRQKG